MPTKPDRVPVLIDFLNTVDIEAHTDVLASAETFVKWAHAHGHEPGDRFHARTLRDAIRSSLQGLPKSLPELALNVRLDSAGTPRLAPTDIAQAAISEAIELAVTGDWNRVKLCPADDCLEAFYDTSRNHSRIWCDMADCGNLAKVHKFRDRTAAHTPQREQARPGLTEQ